MDQGCDFQEVECNIGRCQQSYDGGICNAVGTGSIQVFIYPQPSTQDPGRLGKLGGRPSDLKLEQPSGCASSADVRDSQPRRELAVAAGSYSLGLNTVGSSLAGQNMIAW